MVVEIRKEKEREERKKIISANQRNLIVNYFVKDYPTFVFLKI